MRIAHIRNVTLALHVEIMYLGVECSLHLRRIAAEVDREAILGYLVYGETVIEQPIRNRVDVGLRRAKLLPLFIGLQPVMIVRGSRIAEARSVGFGRSLLFGAAAQDEQHPRHLEIGFNRTAVEVGASLRAGVSFQNGKMVFIDPLGRCAASRAGLAGRHPGRRMLSCLKIQSRLRRRWQRLSGICEWSFYGDA